MEQRMRSRFMKVDFRWGIGRRDRITLVKILWDPAIKAFLETGA
jgi:hypothetical protein